MSFIHLVSDLHRPLLEYVTDYEFILKLIEYLPLLGKFIRSCIKAIYTAEIDVNYIEIINFPNLEIVTPLISVDCLFESPIFKHKSLINFNIIGTQFYREFALSDLISFCSTKSIEQLSKVNLRIFTNYAIDDVSKFSNTIFLGIQGTTLSSRHYDINLSECMKALQSYGLGKELIIEKFIGIHFSPDKVIYNLDMDPYYDYNFSFDNDLDFADYISDVIDIMCDDSFAGRLNFKFTSRKYNDRKILKTCFKAIKLFKIFLDELSVIPEISHKEMNFPLYIETFKEYVHRMPNMEYFTLFVKTFDNVNFEQLLVLSGNRPIEILYDPEITNLPQVVKGITLKKFELAEPLPDFDII